MEAALAAVDKLGQAKRLIPAEEIIMSTIDALDPYLPSITDETQLAACQKSLISLFSINSGDLSVQCAIHIASKLLIICNNAQKPKLIDILTFTISSLSTSTIIATGFLCRQIGEKNKSQLPRFIECLLKNGHAFPFASLYALRACFVAGGKTVHQYASAALDFASNVAVKATTQTVVAGLKFARTLVKTGEVRRELILEFAKGVVARDGELPFVKDGVSTLVARCAYEAVRPNLIEPKASTSEWAVRKKGSRSCNFTPAFEIIQAFPTVMSRTFLHFITLMGPEVTSVSHSELFKFVRASVPDQVTRLIPLLPGDSRYTYFRSILNEPLSVQKLKLLSVLSQDDNGIQEAAKVALRLACTPNKAARKESAEFFATVTKTQPFLAEQYLNNVLRVVDDDAVFGNIAIAQAIIANLRDKEQAIAVRKDEVRALLDQYLQQPPNSAKFVAGLQLLSVLPKSLAATPVATKAVDAVMRESSPSKLLLKAVFAFRARYMKPSQNTKLVEWLFRVSPKSIPKSVLGNLCSIVPKVAANTDVSVLATNAVLERAAAMKPSHVLAKSFLRNPLPLASELIGDVGKPGKADKFLDIVIRKFPIMVASCPPDKQGEIIKSVLEPQKQNRITLLLCASMCESKATRKRLPVNLHQYLLSLLTAKNAALMQAVCECIALFCKTHVETIGQVFGYVEAHPGAASCILLSSLFAHVSVPPQFLTRTLIFLDSQLKEASTSGVALHAVTSLIRTHSMQLSTLGVVASGQLPLLFQAIHRSFSLQPVTLAIIGECFRTLVESFSSELAIPENPLLPTVILCLKSIRITPISYAKEVYYDCCQAIYTFCHQLKRHAPITFPMSRGSPTNRRLAACEAFSFYFKFEKADLNTHEVVPLLLSLLQMTGDERAGHFLAALASTMTSDDLSFWVATVRRVLVVSSLIDSNTLSIEPTQQVKRGCLDTLPYIIDEVANAPVLVTEYLDDIISSLCRATETGSVQLQEAAFPVLQRVITMFRDKINDEGGRVLDLYDSQFATVVKVGFQLSLSVSGGFLSTYLTFNTDNMANDPENSSAILVVYLNSLDSCRERSTSFYSLAAHLCTVGRKYAQIRPLVESFLLTMTPIFADVVNQAMALWENRTDWRKISEYRQLAHDFYGELLPAFVWLQTISKVVVKVDVLVSFFVIEMKLSKEQWMVSAAFEALTTALDFCGKEISSEMLELAMTTALGFTGTDEKQLIINSATLLREDSSWDSLRECILSLSMSDPKRYSPVTFAYLLKSDTRHVLSKYALAIAQFFIQKYCDMVMDTKQANALFTVLFNHTPSIVVPVCDYCIAMKSLSTEFKLMIIDLGLLVIGHELHDLSTIPRYLLATFKKGGMHLIGKFLNVRPKVGMYLFIKGASKAAFLLALKDRENIRAYIWFLQLGLLRMNDYDKSLATQFAPCMFRFCVKVIELCENDPLNGRMIVWHCIRVIHDAVRISTKPLDSIYSEINADTRAWLVSVLTKHIESEIQTQKLQALVEFSTSERSHRQSEWTTLEIGDSD